jgi:hypothetical protein
MRTSSVLHLITRLVMVGTTGALMVQIIAPPPGAFIRRGQGVSVVLRVIDTGPQGDVEMQHGDELPRGLVMMMAQDNEPAEIVGRILGHVGVLQGLSDGPHALRAWLEDGSGLNSLKLQASTHFFVGLPQPVVSILHPKPGAVVYDDPLEVLFSATDFEVPVDGFLQVSLDGRPQCTERDEALFNCDLPGIEAGTHTVSVSLLHATSANETGVVIPVASRTVTFSVRRPSVRIVYPPTGRIVVPETRAPHDMPVYRVYPSLSHAERDQGNDRMVSMRLSVLHATPSAHAPLFLHLHVTLPGVGGGGDSDECRGWSHVMLVERADHYAFGLILPQQVLETTGDDRGLTQWLTVTASLLAHPSNAYGSLRVPHAGHLHRPVQGIASKHKCVCPDATDVCQDCQALTTFKVLSTATSRFSALSPGLGAFEESGQEFEEAMRQTHDNSKMESPCQSQSEDDADVADVWGLGNGSHTEKARVMRLRQEESWWQPVSGDTDGNDQPPGGAAGGCKVCS